MDILEEIKSRVTMRDVLSFYGIYPIRGNNIYRCFVHNDKKPSANIIKGSEVFHCLAKETEILTSNGIFKIGDLVGQDVEILNGNGEWEKVTIKCYGKQKLYKITLCRGGNKFGKITKDIYATAKHRWFITRQTKSGFSERTTDELQKGNILVSLETKAKNIEFDIDGIRHGFIYGDGFKRIARNDKVAVACFYTKPKEKLMKYFNNCEWKKHPSGKYFYQSKYIANRPLTELPTKEDSHEYILGFLAGYFGADGSFGKGTCKISCADKEKLEKVRDLCIYEKIMCKKIHSQYRLGINNKYSWIHDFSVIASSLPNGFDLTERFIPKQTKMNYIHWNVLSVEETDRDEDVFCCETSTGSFALADNILTGNCFSCQYSGDIFSVVQHFEKCDFKTSMRILDDRYGLGLYKQLSHKEKLEIARRLKEREQQKEIEKKWKEFENSVLCKIADKIHFWEQVQTDSHITRGEFRRGEWKLCDIFFESLKKQDFLNWLYNAICGFDHPECEYDYIYPQGKRKLLEMIRKGEINI